MLQKYRGFNEFVESIPVPFCPRFGEANTDRRGLNIFPLKWKLESRSVCVTVEHLWRKIYFCGYLRDHANRGQEANLHS